VKLRGRRVEVEVTLRGGDAKGRFDLECVCVCTVVVVSPIIYSATCPKHAVEIETWKLSDIKLNAPVPRSPIPTIANVVYTGDEPALEFLKCGYAA
jgi:hypothetical protein